MANKHISKNIIFINIEYYIEIVYLYRHADDSFVKGVLTVESYEYGKTRTMVSLKLCFLSWMYELFGTAVTVLSPTLHSLGIRYYYYVDAIIMFLVIPFCHLMNDDETKATIIEKGWYHGFKFMAGFKDNRIEATE